MKEFKYYLDTPEEQMEDEDKIIKKQLVDTIISKVLDKEYNASGSLLIFQEQIMKLFTVASRGKGGEILIGKEDDARRAIGKKDVTALKPYEVAFISGWNDYIGCFGQEVWDSIVGFASYCFNKSHAVAYTQVSLKTGELYKDHKEDYMLYVYYNSDKVKKANAINQLLETSGIKFPDFSRPFEGLKIFVSTDDGTENEIELKEIEFEEENEEANNTDKYPKPEKFEYTSFGDLFLANLSPSLKLNLILRGVYDSQTLDIKGLAEFNKKLGTKNQCGYLIPNIEKLGIKETLDGLQCLGYIKFRDLPERFEIVVLNRTNKDFTPDNTISINKGINLGTWSSEKTKYRNEQLLKQFGIIKRTGLSVYIRPFYDDFDKNIEIINGVIDKFLKINPGVKNTQKNFESLMKHVPKIQTKFDAIKKQIEDTVLTAYISDKVVMKNGSCCFHFVFGEDYSIVKLYSKDKNIIQTFDKHSTVSFSIVPKTYIGRDGHLKKYFDIKAV